MIGVTRPYVSYAPLDRTEEVIARWHPKYEEYD